MQDIRTSRVHSIADHDGAALLDVERGLISTLNATGAYVWQSLQRDDSLETIVLNLAQETGEAFPVVNQDVRDFVEKLCENGLWGDSKRGKYGE